MARANVIRFVRVRWMDAKPDSIAAEVSKCANARGMMTIAPVAVRLDALARRHDMIAAALRLAARAARGEDIDALAVAPLPYT